MPCNPFPRFELHLHYHKTNKISPSCSILYADIVGFTAISSTYCAQDLVKILNELFARFDRLAEVSFCINVDPMWRAREAWKIDKANEKHAVPSFRHEIYCKLFREINGNFIGLFVSVCYRLRKILLATVISWTFIVNRFWLEHIPWWIIYLSLQIDYTIERLILM